MHNNFLQCIELPSVSSVTVVCYTGMEYEDQEQELEYRDGEIEWDMENRDEIEPGSHDDPSGSPDTKKPFAVPDISADVAKGKAAKQQIGKE